MKRYVVGFAFYEGMGGEEHVVLIRKNRPTWQAGRLNGVGGHIEEGEDPVDAMAREFREEAGVTIWQPLWNKFARLSGNGFEVHLFRAKTQAAIVANTRTDEEVVHIPVSELENYEHIPNLSWLIPMAKSMDMDLANQFEIREL